MRMKGRSPYNPSPPRRRRRRRHYGLFRSNDIFVLFGTLIFGGLLGVEMTLLVLLPPSSSNDKNLQENVASLSAMLFRAATSTDTLASSLRQGRGARDAILSALNEQDTTVTTTTRQQNNHKHDYTQQCTPKQLSIILQQLPPQECAKNHDFTTMCSFSYATCCPQAVWLEDLYNAAAVVTTISSSSSKQPPPQRTAVYVGCNKALDAVNTLRMLSQNAQYDKAVWRKALFGDEAVPTGSCGQEKDDQYVIPALDAATSHMKNTVVHCIEALPTNAIRLEHAAEQLGWQDSLLVKNVAIGPANAAPNATMLFPDANHHLIKGLGFGVETANAGNCEGRRVQHCKPVPVFSLDRYIQEQVVPIGGGDAHAAATDTDMDTTTTTMIDFLSIDIEGLDWTVLQGSKLLTKHVQYLEFEYNHKGPWKQQKLREAIDQLEQQGFVCYWPGVGGNIWRITGCWLDHYDYHFWSNVACGNQALGAAVLEHMEARFQATLDAGAAIQYNHLQTAKTNGRNFPAVPTYPPEETKK